MIYEKNCFADISGGFGISDIRAGKAESLEV
jgi:hypothetical protein